MIDPSQLHTRAESLVAEANRIDTDLKHLQEMMSILYSGFNYLDDKARETTPEIREGAYAYIPYDIGMFLEVIMDLKNVLQNDPHYQVRSRKFGYRPIRFLEVGCGIGRNLFLLKHAKSLRFTTVHGVEIVPSYLEVARRTFHLDKNVFEGDALQFDYSSYDVVYFYRPFSDEKFERRFESRVIKQLKPGAYILSGLALQINKPKDMTPGESWRIWRKNVPEAPTNGAAGKTHRPKHTTRRR